MNGFKSPLSLFFFLLVGSMCIWGGNACDHARAQEQSWVEILRFFKYHLQTPTVQAKL
jgi:hypothetical protein